MVIRDLPNAAPVFDWNENPDQFPVAGLPPRLQCCIKSFMHCTDAPLSAVASVMLGVMSIVSHQRFSVEKKRNLTSPLTLWMLVLQDSGERKSTVLNAALEGTRHYVRARSRDFEIHKRQREVMHEVWTSSLKKMKRDAERLGDDPKELSEVMKRIEHHLDREPKLPIQTRPLLEDATSEALVRSMVEAGGSATAIVTDEMTRILRGRVLRDLGFLCKTYDGSQVQVDRVDFGTITLERPLVSLLLMGQTEIFDEIMKRSGKEWSSSGFLPRFLITKALPRAGSRFIVESSDQFQIDSMWFAGRCQELLAEADEGFTKERAMNEVLRFSPSAQKFWVEYYNRVEMRMRPGQDYSRVKEFSSRLADKAARIAALLHIFNEERDENISQGEVECAIDIAEWFAKQYIKNLGEYSLPNVEVDALELKKFMVNKYSMGQGCDFLKSYLRQSGPNRIRSTSRLTDALELLQSKNEVTILEAGSVKTIVRLNLGAIEFSNSSYQLHTRWN